MQKERIICTAITKAGARCKNRAMNGATVCRIHAKQATPEPAAQPTPEQRHQFEATIAEINRLAQKLQQMAPDYSPPPYSPPELVRLLKENMARFTPEVRLDILRDLQAGLTGPAPKDLLNVETWKGLWYLLNYAAESKSRSLLSDAREFVGSLPGMGLLASLPGASTMSQLVTMLEGSSPRDFMDVETWKGVWFLVNYSVNYELESFRKRVTGEMYEDEEE